MIALGQDNTVKQRPEHPSRRQQILKRPQRPRDRLAVRDLQVGPRGRDHQMAAVRQHHDQLQPTTAAHPPHQLKRLTVPCVMSADDPHRPREAIEVGSVSCLPSIASATSG